MPDARKILGSIDDPPPVLATLPPMQSALPQLDAPVAPSINVDPRFSSGNAADPLTNRASDVSADLYNRTHPLAPTTALGKIGHIAANIGNVLGNIFAPAETALIPHSQLNNEIQNQRDRSELEEISGLQTQQAQRAQTEAQTAYAEQRPDIEKAKMQQKSLLSNNKNAVTASDHGLIQSIDENGNATFEADPDNPITQLAQSRRADSDAQVALRQAQTEWEKAKLDPNSQAGKIAWGNLQARMMEAQAARVRATTGVKQYMMHAFGTDENGAPLAASMITDDGRSVGTAFQQNVRPTGQERSKADMAFSAEEQLNDITDIVKKNPDLFGPGYGQTTAFKKWIGAQSPDAQRFMAARTIAGDHLAGTFGGRSEAALSALDNAIGQFKDNPEAALAGIGQLTKANTRFERAGTVHTVGSVAPSASGKPSEGATKTNSAGDKIVFRGGKWGPA